MAIYRVKTDHDVADLVAGLTSSSRREPWCVVTSQPFGDVPFAVNEIAEQTAGICDIWVVPNGPLTYLLAEQLPPDCEVFGGAARTYPPGISWMKNPVEAKRRFWNADAKLQAQQLESLISDVHAMAYEAGLLDKRAGNLQKTNATIVSFMAEGARAFVKLANGSLSAIAQELTIKEVPLDRFLAVGQVVSGTFDNELNRFLIDVPRVTAQQFLERFVHGTVTVGLVKSSERASGVITLFPGLDVTIKRSDTSSNPKDRVDLFFEPGDVVAVRIIRDPQGHLALRTLDIDDDEILADALPIIDGGKPWLTPEEDYLPVRDELEVEPIESFLARFGLTQTEDAVSAEAEQAPEAPLETRAAPRFVPGPGMRQVVPVPAPAKNPEVAEMAAVDSDALSPTERRDLIAQLQLTITTLKRENQRLLAGNLESAGEAMAHLRGEQARALAGLVRERDDALAAAVTQRDRANDLRKQLQEARRQQILGLDFDENRTKFAPDAAGAFDWLNFELGLAWIDRVSPAERARNPLPQFTIGDNFIASFEALSNGKKNKALRAMLDILSGDSGRLNAREVHALRQSEGANSPDVVRSDGAKCLRAYIEEKSPSARRLHYWLLPHNEIEFSRVVLHDDMEP